MLLAEGAVGLDTLVGGGVFGMLVVVMTAFLKRTKETDDRRDDVSKMLVAAAVERETKAWAERDRVWAQLEEERRQWQMERLTLMNRPSRSRPKSSGPNS
jgi:hypothetical protein